MMGWIFLVAAIVAEVAATLSLRVASGGRNTWYTGVVMGYLLAFAFLAGTLSNGIGLGVAYGIWAAAGVALTAIASRILFNETLNTVMTLGIILVVGGVLLIETGAAHP